MKRDELIGCGVVFLFGGTTAVLSLSMPLGTFRMAGSGLFPLCLGILLMILAALFATDLLFLARGPSPEARKGTAEPPANTRLVLQFLGVTAGSTVCLGFLGYPAFCLLMMAFLLRILGVRRPALLLGLSLATAAGAYIIFVWLLKIPLPKGLIGL
jgi:hypothetical protein